MAQDPNRFDLRNLARGQFLDVVASLKSQYRSVKFVLIVDTASSVVLGSLFKTVELVEHNIVLLERYDLQRKALPSYHAIYFLSPTVALQGEKTGFINDFSAEPRYAAAHLLFTYQFPDSVMETLQRFPQVIDRILTFKYLFLQFTPFDPFTFWVNASGAFNSLYSPQPSKPWQMLVHHISMGLISFFFSIKSQPLVAFEKGNEKIRQLVTHFQSGMSAAVGALPPDVRGSVASNNTLLLFVSRGLDPVSPLLHQFTYEAMVYDHFQVDNEQLQLVPNDNNSIIYMSYYEDATFQKVRFLPSFEMEPVLSEERRPVLELERLQTGGDTAEIRRDATKKLARMTVCRNQVHNHWIVLSKLSDLTAPGTSLVPMAEYEQAMATGRESLEEVFKPSTPKLIQRLSQPGISAFDAARLVALYQVRGKKLDAELDKICDGPRIDPKHRQAIRNIATLLGPMYNRKSDDVVVPKINGLNPVKADKYLPLVYQLVNNALDGKVDGKVFEVPPHSGRYQNIVVFVVGGISYMELRWLDAIRTRLKGTKLYAGSTCPLTPRAFLAQLAALSGQ